LKFGVAFRAVVSLLDVGATNFDGLAVPACERYEIRSLVSCKYMNTHLLMGRNSEVVRDPMTEVRGMIREHRLFNRMRVFIRSIFSRKSTCRMSTIHGSEDPRAGRQIAVRATMVPRA
jgi:hypothetical protein